MELKQILLLFALLAAAGVAQAQTRTLVTGTITDPHGVPYGGAVLSGVLISPGGQSPSLTPCNNPGAGCQIQQAVPPTTLGPAGQIQGLSLWANASILPAGTTYTFTVTLSPGVLPPLGTGPQSCTVAGVTIAGATQNISSSFTSCPSLTTITSGGGNCSTTAITAGYLLQSNGASGCVAGPIDNGVTIAPGIIGLDEAVVSEIASLGTLPFESEPSGNVENGDFDEPFFGGFSPIPPPGWAEAGGFTGTLSYNTTTPYNGSASLIDTCPASGVCSVSSNHFMSVNPGDVIQAQCAMRVDSGTVPASCAINYLLNSSPLTGAQLFALTTSSASFVLVTGTGIVPPGAYAVDLTINAGGATASTSEYDAMNMIDLTQVSSPPPAPTPCVGICTGTLTLNGSNLPIPSAVYGRWGRLAWSHINDTYAQSGDIQFNNASSCLSATTNSATAGLPSYEGCTTSGTINSTGYVNGASGQDFHTGTAANPTNVRLADYGELAASLTNVRTWFAASDQTQSTVGLSDTPAGNLIGFRFSSTASDTTYKAVMCASSTCNAISTGVTAVAGAWHRFEIVCNDTVPSCAFYIDGNLTVVSGTDYPSNVALSIFQIMDNTTAVAQSWAWAEMYYSTAQ